MKRSSCRISGLAAVVVVVGAQVACDDSGRWVCPDGEGFDWTERACVDVVVGEPVAADVWRPATGTTWQWQLSGTLDRTPDVAMYDVDLAETSDVDLAALKADGRVVICYFSAGTLESYRTDVGGVAPEAIGSQLIDWPDEQWLDVTHPTVRELALSRLDRAAERGCDGVEPDNVDAADNANGLALNVTEQLAFNRFLADAAHERGLSVGLKNAVSWVEDLGPWFDWALNEECHTYEECGAYTGFVVADRAVFNAEYVDDWTDAEATASRVCGYPGLSTIVKTWDLGPEHLACPDEAR